jgi:hypothetical protein
MRQAPRREPRKGEIKISKREREPSENETRREYPGRVWSGVGGKLAIVAQA